MRKSIVAALVVVAAVAGVAVAAVPLIEHRAAAQIKADMERDGAAHAASVEVGLFDRKIAMKDLRVKNVGEIAIGRWEASGLAWPLSELIEGRTPLSGLKLGDPLRAGHVELSDVRISENNGRWSIASLAIDDLRLERYDPVVGPGQFTALSMRIAKALSMARLEQKQIAFTDAARGDSVSIGNLEVGRFDKGQIGSIEMNELDVVPKSASEPVFRMADLKLKGLDLRRPFNAMGSSGWRPGLPIGRVELESGSLSGFGGAGLRRYGIALGSITSQTQLESKDVRRSRVRIEGFVMAPPADNREAVRLRGTLQSMGLKELRLDLDCAGTEDRDKNELTVDRCVLAGPDLGELDLSFRLARADAAFWRAIDDGNSFAMLGSKVGLAGARITLVDRGVVERTLKAAAAGSGQPLAAVRAGFAQEARRFQPPGILITEDLTKLLDTVARFVETGGTLTLDAKPDTPIGIDKFAALSRPGSDLVNLLGLSATLSR